MDSLVLLLIVAICCILGVSLGLFLLRGRKSNFPEFFSPKLSNTDIDFFVVSQNLYLVNELSDEELTYEYFTKSR